MHLSEPGGATLKRLRCLHDKRFERCVNQMREEIESTHTCEGGAQIVCLNYEISGDYSMMNTHTYTGVSHKSPMYTVG